MNTLPTEIIFHIFELIPKNGRSHIMLVSRKFLEIGRQAFDPSEDNNRAIRKAAEHGMVAAVASLLKDSRINPASAGNYALQTAAWNGHLEIVKLLLRDPRTDPSDLENYAIYPACENGHVDVVRELLTHPAVDPSVCRNHAIRYAATNGHLDVVKVLMKDKRVNPADLENYAIRFAAANGHWQVVQELLKDDRVDASQNNNEALRRASERGEVEVVCVLLKDKRVDPGAVDYGFLRVIDLLGYWQLANFCIECKQSGIKRTWNPQQYLYYGEQYQRGSGYVNSYSSSLFFDDYAFIRVPTMKSPESKTIKSRRQSTVGLVQ